MNPPPLFAPTCFPPSPHNLVRPRGSHGNKQQATTPTPYTPHSRQWTSVHTPASTLLPENPSLPFPSLSPPRKQISTSFFCLLFSHTRAQYRMLDPFTPPSLSLSLSPNPSTTLPIFFAQHTTITPNRHRGLFIRAAHAFSFPSPTPIPLIFFFWFITQATSPSVNCNTAAKNLPPHNTCGFLTVFLASVIFFWSSACRETVRVFKKKKRKISDPSSSKRRADSDRRAKK